MISESVEEEEDVGLREFSDEIEGWIIDEFSRIGLDTAKHNIDQDMDDLIKKTDM